MLINKNCSSIFVSFLLLMVLVIEIEMVKNRNDNGSGKSGRRWKKPQQLITSTMSSASNGFDEMEASFQSSQHHHVIQPQSLPVIGNMEHEDEYFDEVKSSTHSCEDIRIDVCRDVGYNVTSMPNFVGHELQADAELQLQSFLPLISYGCSSQLKFFLCSVYVPMCTEKVRVIIGPCRPLCESVRSRCAPVLQELGFPWPAALNCSKFVAENSVDRMCMEGPPPHELEDQESLVPSVVHQNHLDHHSHHQSSQDHHLQDHHHHYPTMLKGSNRKQSIETPSLGVGSILPANILTHNVPSFSNHCMEYRHSEHYIYLEHPRGRCVAQCRTDILFTVDNKEFIDYWTVVWSVLALASCLFTMLAFLLSTKFQYPERAIFYISACYAVYSMAYIYRAIIGREQMSCYHEGPTNDLWLLVQEGAHNPHCTVSFLMLYYFGMAGAAWWLVLSTSWSMSIALGWSMSKISEYSQLYHSFAWAVPAIQTLAALVMRAVDADELTGICFVGSQNDENLMNFVIIPMTLYLNLGIAIIILSFLSVRFNYFASASDRCCSCFCGDRSNSNGDVFGDHRLSKNYNHCNKSTGSTTTGCSDFCRRFRRNYSSCNGHHHGGGLRAIHAGSGHSLLLPNNGQAANFCSTVSSTSSYSSAASSSHKTEGVVDQQRHQNIAFNQFVPISNGNCSNANDLFLDRITGVVHHQTTGGALLPFNDCSQKLASNNLQNHHLKPSSMVHRSHRQTTMFDSHGHDTDQNQKDAALVRSGIFVLFYTLPALCVLATYLYEYMCRSQWLLRMTGPSGSNGGSAMPNQNTVMMESIAASRPNFEVFNMRLFMSLVIGIKTGIWILTAKSPMSAFHCLFNRFLVTKKGPPFTTNTTSTVTSPAFKDNKLFTQLHAQTNHPQQSHHNHLGFSLNPTSMEQPNQYPHHGHQQQPSSIDPNNHHHLFHMVEVNKMNGKSGNHHGQSSNGGFTHCSSTSTVTTDNQLETIFHQHRVPYQHQQNHHNQQHQQSLKTMTQKNFVHPTLTMSTTLSSNNSNVQMLSNDHHHHHDHQSTNNNDAGTALFYSNNQIGGTNLQSNLILENRLALNHHHPHHHNHLTQPEPSNKHRTGNETAV